MQAPFRMALDKETDNKYRWRAFLAGDVAFKLYIPKWRCPSVPPRKITVGIMGMAAQVDELKWDLCAQVVRVEEHTETVRYRPHGDPEDWEIGEPYVPHCVLPEPWPDQITIGVAWG